MSQPVFEIDERLWGDYLMDCRANDVHPKIKDFLIWCDENDIERPEAWDGEQTDVA